MADTTLLETLDGTSVSSARAGTRNQTLRRRPLAGQLDIVPFGGVKAGPQVGLNLRSGGQERPSSCAPCVFRPTSPLQGRLLDLPRESDRLARARPPACSTAGGGGSRRAGCTFWRLGGRAQLESSWSGTLSANGGGATRPSAAVLPSAAAQAPRLRPQPRGALRDATYRTDQMIKHGDTSGSDHKMSGQAGVPRGYATAGRYQTGRQAPPSTSRRGTRRASPASGERLAEHLTRDLHRLIISIDSRRPLKLHRAYLATSADHQQRTTTGIYRFVYWWWPQADGRLEPRGEAPGDRRFAHPYTGRWVASTKRSTGSEHRPGYETGYSWSEHHPNSNPASALAVITFWRHRNQGVRSLGGARRPSGGRMPHLAVGSGASASAWPAAS